MWFVWIVIGTAVCVVGAVFMYILFKGTAQSGSSFNVAPPQTGQSRDQQMMNAALMGDVLDVPDWPTDLF